MFEGLEGRFTELADTFADSAFLVGNHCQQMYGGTVHEQREMILVSHCMGCNMCYHQLNEGCNHAHSRPRACIAEDSELELGVHKLIISMGVIIHLLMRDDCDKLVLLLTPEPPAGVSGMTWMFQQLQRGNFRNRNLILPHLIGLLDNVSMPFPKVGSFAAAMLSLLVGRRPATCFSTIDPDSIGESLSKYLSTVFELVHNNECWVESYSGVVELLNIIPFLYHIGSWKQVAQQMSSGLNTLNSMLTTLIINICHFAAQDGNDSWDGPPNLVEFPEMQNFKVFLKPLLRNECINGREIDHWRIDLLLEHPMSFAVAAGLEVLARWATKGVQLVGTISVSRGEPPTIAGAIAEYMDKIEVLIQRCSPRLDYIRPLATDLAQGRVPPKPRSSAALLRGPLDQAYARCGLVSCRSITRQSDPSSQPSNDDEESENWATLYECSGGCQGLEVYCCRQHQKEHWGHHKLFCRANRG